jgi:hypothetical protein
VISQRAAFVSCTRATGFVECATWSIGQCANLPRVSLVQSIVPCASAMVFGETRRGHAAYARLLARIVVLEGLG